MSKEEYISWNSMSEEEKAEFFKSNPFKKRTMSKAEKNNESRWSEEEIFKLIRFANFVFEVEIPLATEIRKTVEYLQACRLIGRTDKDRMFLVAEVKTEVKYKIRFMPSRYSRNTEELPIPEDVLMCAYDGVRKILDNKCNHLAKRSGYKQAMKDE